jgi:hypothetical protein
MIFDLPTVLQLVLLPVAFYAMYVSFLKDSV